MRDVTVSTEDSTMNIVGVCVLCQRHISRSTFLVVCSVLIRSCLVKFRFKSEEMLTRMSWCEGRSVKYSFECKDCVHLRDEFVQKCAHLR